MIAGAKQWTLQTLPIEEVRQHSGFQMRADGVNPGHARKLLRQLQAGADLPPIRVALVGRAHYVVDGYHRLEAHRRDRRDTIKAEVARMSLPEAKEAAMKANTTHGLNLSRADRARIWEAFVARGDHLGPEGTAKPVRVLEADLNGVYSRETIRVKLGKMDVELAETDTQKPWGGQPDPEYLATERAEEARELLTSFGAIVPTLDDMDRPSILQAARELLEALERGETGEGQRAAIRNPLDI